MLVTHSPEPTFRRVHGREPKMRLGRVGFYEVVISVWAPLAPGSSLLGDALDRPELVLGWPVVLK